MTPQNLASPRQTRLQKAQAQAYADTTTAHRIINQENQPHDDEYHQAIDALHQAQNRRAQLSGHAGLHTTLPIGALILVHTQTPYVVQRVQGGWRHLDNPTVITFEEAFSCDEGNPAGDEFTRLYTSQDVDALLDDAEETLGANPLQYLPTALPEHAEVEL